MSENLYNTADLKYCIKVHIFYKKRCVRCALLKCCSVNEKCTGILFSMGYRRSYFVNATKSGSFAVLNWA